MKLVLSYFVAWLAGCLELMFVQMLLKLSGLSTNGMFKPEVIIQNSFGLLVIFLVGYVIDIPGAKVGLKRWNGLAIAFSVSVLLVLLMNLGPKPDWKFMMMGTVLVAIVLGLMYLSLTFLGEKVYVALERRSSN